MRKVDCSIIIINYNTSKLIVELIKSIKYFSSKYTNEYIVVDNFSSNDNPKRISEKFPDVKLILNSENLGFGRANNQGIELASGRYILMLNADTLLMDDALDQCIQFMDMDFAKSNNIGLLGIKLLNEDRSHQSSTFPEFNLLNYLITSNALLSKVRFSFKESIDDRKSQFVGGVSGAFMLFRREVFDIVKPFDPDIFMYSEETELCRERVGKYYRIYFWAGASIIHYGGVSSGRSLQLQEMVSYALTWYKRGPLFYLIYFCSLCINTFTESILILFMKKKNRERAWGRVKNFPRLSYYLIFEIPKYSAKWGSRPSPLKAHP